MATQQKVSGKSACRSHHSGRLGAPRSSSAQRAHLWDMDTPAPHQLDQSARSSDRDIFIVVTLSELAAQLGVSVQTLYDLRSQGRGPRGFRVGRELRFRVAEVEAWLAELEADDAERHPRVAG